MYLCVAAQGVEITAVIIKDVTLPPNISEQMAGKTLVISSQAEQKMNQQYDMQQVICTHIRLRCQSCTSSQACVAVVWLSCKRGRDTILISFNFSASIEIFSIFLGLLYIVSFVFLAVSSTTLRCFAWRPGKGVPWLAAELKKLRLRPGKLGVSVAGGRCGEQRWES